MKVAVTDEHEERVRDPLRVEVSVAMNRLVPSLWQHQ
jgi:hypothetical protein